MNFKQRLKAGGYPKQDIERSLSEVHFDQTQLVLKQRQKSKERPFPDKNKNKNNIGSLCRSVFDFLSRAQVLTHQGRVFFK